jgi:hypothetical protein
MRDVLREHNARYPYVRSVFYMYDPTCVEPWSLEGDMLRIRGNETFIPGILTKTLEAMRITHSWEYDLLIRTNISTIVDFGGLIGYCTSPSFEYGGPQGIIKWTDPPGGIFDGRFYGMPFIRGWCMIFSRATISLMMQDSHFIDTSVIDDVAIADFLVRKRGIKPVDLYYKTVIETTEYDQTKLIFRNCTYGNRELDAERMQLISSKICP